MNYLLDTHYVLWTLFNPEKITSKVKEILLDSGSVKFVSTVNIWEISLKYRLGKLVLGELTPEQLYESVLESGFVISEIEPVIYASYHHLPLKEDHRDPFDRMLIWQAINCDLTLLTADKKIKQYLEDGLKLVI